MADPILMWSMLHWCIVTLVDAMLKAFMQFLFIKGKIQRVVIRLYKWLTKSNTQKDVEQVS